MKHLYVIVEGETEEEFVKRILIPHLNARGIHSNIQPIKITRRGGGHGFNNIEHLKNTIEPFLHHNNRPVITTMVDFFRIPNNIPGYQRCKELPDADQQIDCLQSGLSEAVNAIVPYDLFIPYIQKHEWEALLFSNPEEAFELVDEKIKQDVISVRDSFHSPEEINTTPEGAPGKRLAAIFRDHQAKYVKGADAADLAELGGIEAMLDTCPRFAAWIDQLMKAVREE